MGNYRGNAESRNHLYLSPERRKFWEFSWHEMGEYDLPAMIDHVLKQTGKLLDLPVLIRQRVVHP